MDVTNVRQIVRKTKICIFGFSRGVHRTCARWMVHKARLFIYSVVDHGYNGFAQVGLSPLQHQQVPFAYRMFGSGSNSGCRQSVIFKKTFSVDVEIEFIGVW